MAATSWPDAAPPTLLDRLIGRLDPARGLRRHYYRQQLQRAYAAASPGDSWRPRRAGASANTDHQADAATLRAKSRNLVQNVDYIAAGMNWRAAQIIGTGIVAQFGGRDGAALQAAYDQWVKVADADGGHLHALQARAQRTLDVDGEVLLRRRNRRAEDGLPVPMQVQNLEVDWLDTMRRTADGTGNDVVLGKEYDAIGRIVAYWLWDRHPGDTTLIQPRGGMVSKRVPAEDIIHLYAPTRPGQARGFPRLAPVINRARDLQLLEDAELARKNLEGRLSVLASGDAAMLGNISEGDAASIARQTGSLGDLPSGGITQVPGGMNITVVEPKAAPGFVDYVRHNIHLVAAGGGFSYEAATGDMSGVNFSSARVRLLDLRREFEQLQWTELIPVMCEGVCRWFVEAAELSGIVPGRRAIYTLDHSTPKWDYVNPAQDVQADLDEIAGGLSSFSEKLRRRGYDPKLVFDELERDIKDLQGRGIWDALLMLLKGKTSGAPSAGDASSPASSAPSTTT